MKRNQKKGAVRVWRTDPGKACDRMDQKATVMDAAMVVPIL